MQTSTQKTTTETTLAITIIYKLFDPSPPPLFAESLQFFFLNIDFCEVLINDEELILI